MRVTFLGQAGVLLESDGERLVIDPYLSDNLGLLSEGMWARAVPIPITIRDLVGVRAVVCTHEHADHLDPVTIAALLTASPETTLIAPAAALAGLPWRVDPTQLHGMRGENDVAAFGPFTVRSVAAAHSTDYSVERTEEHGSRWCAVVVSAGGTSLFHAGDTVDYDGFAEAVGPVDLACVPINGRGREVEGIVGNLDAHEAADLVRRLPARAALALHWDMFAINPGDPAAFTDALAGSATQALYGPALTSFQIG